MGLNVIAVVSFLVINRMLLFIMMNNKKEELSSKKLIKPKPLTEPQKKTVQTIKGLDSLSCPPCFNYQKERR